MLQYEAYCGYDSLKLGGQKVKIVPSGAILFKRLSPLVSRYLFHFFPNPNIICSPTTQCKCEDAYISFRIKIYSTFLRFSVRHIRLPGAAHRGFFVQVFLSTYSILCRRTVITVPASWNSSSFFR